MKLLFWNLNKKDNANLALACMRENEVGIAALVSFLELNSQMSS